MDKYDERGELAPRDVVARAIYEEQQKGNEIFLDIRHKGNEFLQKRFPNISLELKRRGFDLSRDIIPVTPAAHYSCGGVEVDLYGRTNIKNLFAFGEVSCSGVHGANRLASNSLLEAVVFPLRLKKYLKNIFGHPEGIKRLKDPVPVKYSESRKNPSQILRITTIRKDLQKLMWEKVGIVRTKEDLKKAVNRIQDWEREVEKLSKSRVIANPDLIGSWQSLTGIRNLIKLENMLLVTKLIVRAALKRKKSLGAHYLLFRSD